MRTGLAFVLLAAVACGPSGSSNSPNVVEQAANDVGHEAEHAVDTAREAGRDVEEGIEGVVDDVSGSSAPPAADEDDEGSEDDEG